MPPSFEAIRILARRWILLAAGSLILSGSLSLLLVVGRMPGLDRLVGDPLLFKRGLVVHVGLALVVWFYAFLAGLVSLLPGTGGPGALVRGAPLLALVGICLLLAGALVPGAAPLLSNYIPMIDHPLYAAGWVVFGSSVALALLQARLLPAREPEVGPVEIPAAARCGLQAATIAVLLALLTFAAAWLVTPRTLRAESYYEVLFWGGGHVLQFASSAAMAAVWLILLAPVVGERILSRRAATAIFGLLVLPLLGAPILALRGTLDPIYRVGFTRLMQWGIFPAITLVLIACIAALIRAHRAGRLSLGDGRFLGFVTSAALTLVGFGLGALIRGSTTMVPAHYHAAIGAVTAAFMAVTWPLLAPLGLAPLTVVQARIARWQPLVFGTGQLVFAIGFALAGAHGMARKVYGAEQVRRSFGETAGLVVMGTGGLLAVAGGLAFLALVIAVWRRSLAAEHRSKSWIRSTGSIPSKS